MNAPLQCVIDSNVVMKALVAEEYSDKAIAIVSDPSAVLYVPDLLFIECANVLWKKVQRGEYIAEDATDDLRDLLEMELIVTSTADLAERAFQIAQEFGISAYDASYVALAENLGLPLITADGRLAAKLANTIHQVLTLAMI